MPSNFLYPVVSSPTVNFLDALAAASNPFTPPFAGGPMNNIAGVPAIGSRRFLIRAIEWTSVQNLGLEFDFFGSAAGLTDAVATNTFISRYQFASSNGVRFNGANDASAPYIYYVDGLAIPYQDLDSANAVGVGSLHVAIQNIDVTAKLANAAGAIAVTFYLEPMLGMQG